MQAAQYLQHVHPVVPELVNAGGEGVGHGAVGQHGHDAPGLLYGLERPPAPLGSAAAGRRNPISPAASSTLAPASVSARCFSP